MTVISTNLVSRKNTRLGCVVKQTIDYYLKRGSYVFACFVDFQKAFDRVNYWKLFSQMLDDGSDAALVQLLAFWHSRQTLCVYWQGFCSEKFTVANAYTARWCPLSLFVHTICSPINCSNNTK